MPVLDTNFLIALAAGDRAATDLLESLAGEPLLVPDAVVVEFLTDLRRAADRDLALAALEQDFMVVHPTREWMMEAAAFRAALRRKRALVRGTDFWIAAWARLHHMAVVTRNVKDFGALGVATKTWQA